ncbi:M14 family zinc carboxypeptidase [Kordiimonas sp. SCSIO 12603]|uniref:M14 family zinc carboxypeptidase n=1 Tax=Kordiimonas sp. SCSIO 12603 TaxID=2829596 RepID=UPI0021025768|nr:M14 family zinc carboxypeptidase [Kordiimonas sp. SCSIO 12603]
MYNLKGLMAGLMLGAAMWQAEAVQAKPLDYYLQKGVNYDQSVLKPGEIIGHDIGDQPIRHDLMLRYIEELAANSDRMKAETIGYSHEGRPILFITITSPENHARLDEIKANHLLRTDPKTADQANDDMPVVTWLNYGVHGAEASGMDAAVPTLYHLAAAQGERVENELDNSVILITAIFNPDGHSRRAAWVTQYGSDVLATDPNHEVHNQFWPGARTNHYWFDLNRQWLLQTQPESQAWLAKWHEWKPQVSGDFHEMGPNSTYYFHPGVPTRKYPMIPAKGRELLYEIAGYHVNWLDDEGKLYFSEEGFDNYYIGKGSTYPQVNGSLGILFEAGAQMGIARESDQGLKTYSENVQNHVGTSYSTIQGAVAMREKLHDYQREFFKSGADLAKSDKVKGYVFRAPEDHTRMDIFLDFLSRHKVKAYRVNGSVKAGGGSYGGDSYIVPMDQANYRMAKALFNKITEFPDKVFYDVSGWTMPAAFGLDYAEVTGSIKGKLGDAVTSTGFVAKTPDTSDYAYMFRWSDYYAPKVVNALLQEGIMARVNKEPVRVKTTKGVVAFERGAIIVQKHLQTVSAGRIDRLVQMLAAENNIQVHAVTSGRTLDAGADLGGRNTVSDLKAPKPLLVTGPGVNPYDAGEVWHLLDHRMNMPVTLVRNERLSRVNLDDYTHVILVGGNSRMVPANMKDRVKDWVRSGGTLIAHRQGASWVMNNILPKKKAEKASPSAPVQRLKYSQKGQKDAEHVIGGAVFKSELDITHPMAFGFVRDHVATNRNTSIKLRVPNDPYAQVAVYTDAPLVSGYASDKRIKELKGSPMMTAERFGRGTIVLFADNPNFRATYYGSEKLFLNAIFFSSAFNRSFADDEEAAMEAHSH